MATEDFGQSKGLGWYFAAGVTPLRDVVRALNDLDRAIFTLDMDALGSVVAEVHVSPQVFDKIKAALTARYTAEGVYVDAEGRLIYGSFALKASDSVPFEWSEDALD